MTSLHILTSDGEVHRVDCLACEWVPLDDCQYCNGTRIAKPPSCDCDLCLREGRSLFGADPVVP